MTLKVLFVALFAAVSVQSAAKADVAGPPTISNPSQAIAIFVKCRVTRTGDTMVYGKSDSEVYRLADRDFRVWDGDANKWVFADGAAHWNGKYYTANTHEGVSDGHGSIRTWVFNRSAGSMIYKIQTTRTRYNGSVLIQDVTETRSFDFKCERTLDPSQSNSSDAF